MDNKLNTRCVVTGLGLISAIGNNLQECWDNALRGISGIDAVKSVNADECYVNLGAEVNCLELDSEGKYDRAIQLCLRASKEAMKDANLIIKSDEAYRVGVIMGSCVGGVNSVEDYVERGENTDVIGNMTIAAIADSVANMAGAKGIVTNVGNACAAGSISIAYACELIRAGIADAFIVGGTDAFAAVPFSGFHALHALSEQACSPFNKSNGITLGEGSGALVVESYEHALKRSARIYCDVLSAGISSDAFHITAPRPDGEGQMFAIKTAIKNSGITVDDIDYVNAHGTGTAKNDEAEFLSLHSIFDDSNADLSVSSTKAMVGHCLGAAGAIEAVFSVKALTENKIPPTIGYSDEELLNLASKSGKIDFMPNTMKEKELNYVMSNSFAFGGSNASIIFGKNAGNVEETQNNDKVYITGIGAMTPVANGIDNYIEAVKSGVEPLSTSIRTNVGVDDYKNYGIKMGFYRKLDNFSIMQVLSGLDALTDARVKVNEDNANDIGIIIGTGDGPLTTVYEFQEHISENGNKSGSAFNFPNTVYNAAGGYLSIYTGIKGYNVTVTNGSHAGMSSVCYAFNEIKQNHAKVMLAAGTDENSQVIEKLYRKLGIVASSKQDAYDGDEGFVLGDGSVSLVLESEHNISNGLRYAEVAGYAMTHSTSNNGISVNSGIELKKAIEDACAMAEVKVSDIDAVFGFGNGLKCVDEVEQSVYSDLFENGIKVHNVSNYVGEARAAGSALSVAQAALTLSGKLGCKQPVFYIKDTTAQKMTADVSEYSCVLTTAYAMDGSFTAVVLKKVN